MTIERSTQAMTWRTRPAEHATPITTRRTAVVLLTGLFLLGAQPVKAVPMFMGLGVPDKLTDSDNITNPSATAISADGSTVVGTVRATLHGVPVPGGSQVATRWTQATGQTFIALPPIVGFPGNDFPRFATGVSANGSVIVGSADFTNRFFQSNGAPGTATFFDSELLLQTIGGISGSGATIVGSARTLGTNDSFAYRLTGTTLADLELLPNPGGATGSAGASIVSSDGSVVLGTFQGAAVLWDGSSPRFAPTAPGGQALGPRDVTGDGSIVVGGTLAGAFLWNTASDTVEILDPLPLGNSLTTDFIDFAKAVSDDGSRTIGIAGDGFSNISSSSVLWDENNTPHKITTLLPDIGLEADIAGWDLGTIVDISADGRTILGNGTNPDGKQESWIAVVEQIPMFPDVFWVGRNGDNLWHSDTGTQTNWSDKPDNTGISLTPPGADSTAVVRISGDVVFLNGTPSGQAVTSIAAIFADNSIALILNAPLALGNISSARRVTVNSDLTTESQFRLLGPNMWQSGKISGSAANVASGASRILLDGTLDILAGDKSLDTNLTLQNASDVTHSDGTLTVANGAAITIGPGSLYTIEAGKIVSGQPIVNQGEFSKGSLANEVMIDAPFTLQNGTISAGEGTLTFTKTQSHQGGTYDASSGATIQFLNTLTAVSDTVTATGGGNVALVGGIYRISDRDDTATFNLSGSEGLDINGVTIEAIGTVTNNAKATFQSGTLEGGQVNTNNTLFEGGFVNDTLGSFVITGGNDKRIKGVFRNNGDITQQDGTTLRIEDGGAIVNRVGGTYEVVGSSEISFIGTAGRFENAGGTFEATLATGQSVSFVEVDTPFNVSGGGEVKVAVDTQLALLGGGNHTGTGTFDVAGTLLLSGTHTFDGNFSIEGKGETQVLHAVLAGGQVVVSKGHSLSFSVGVSTLTSTGGTLVIEGGTSDDFAGTFNWDQGTIAATNAPAGTDALVNRGGQVVIEDMGTSITPPVLSNATMRNTTNGTKQGEVTQKGDIVLESGVIINDTGGVWRSEALSETTILNLDVGNRFVNSGGTFIKTGSETARVLVRFDLNKGTVRVDEGTLSLRGGSLSGDSVPFATGDFQIAAGAVLEMPNSFYKFDGVYEATGEGTFLITNTSEFRVSDLFTLNLTGTGKAVFEGESVGGVGGLLINKGNAEWRSGFLENFRNDTGATLKIVAGPAGSDPKKFDATVTDNKGIIDHALGATVDIGDGTTGGGDLTNSGVYNLRGELSLANPLDTPITFQNQTGGRFNLAQPGVQRTYEGQFINNGSVEAAANSTLRLLDVPDNLQTHNGNPNGLLANGRWVANANSKIILGGVNAAKMSRNEANITLRGNGRITNLPDADTGDTGLDFENAGSLRLLEGTVYRTPGDFANSGTLEVDATSELFIAGDFESQSGSNITVNNLLQAQGDFINNGGAFSGSGSVISTGFNNIAGTINPGNSPGTMTIMSNYTHGVAATLEAEIGGLVAGSGYDQLIIEGDATILGGTLSLLLFNGFGPEMGQTFDVMLADTISGAFDTITQPSFLGQPVFGVSVVGLLGGTQQALRVTALQTLPVPEPGTFAVVLAGLIGASVRRRQRFIRIRINHSRS